MSISFGQVGLSAQRYKRVLLDRIGKIIDAGRFFDGDENTRLLNNLKLYLGGDLITLTSSGHDALYLSLRALNLGDEDEVIFPVNAYPTAFPIVQSGARPRPADVDANGQLDPQKLEKLISKNTRVIIVVHLYGLVGDFDRLREICRENKLILIEDCAQAFGSLWRGKSVGTLGDLGCFSFYPTKNLGTLGDGGAIFTKTKKVHAFLQKAVSYGERRRYRSEFIAGHSRMPEIQKAVINVYFDDLKAEFEKRKHLADYYQKTFRRHDLDKWVTFTQSSPHSEPVRHLMTAAVKKRDLLRQFLDQRQIPTMIHYPYPVHLLPAFSFFNLRKGVLPQAENLAKHVLSFPFHSFLSEAEIDYIARTVKDFYETAH